MESFSFFVPGEPITEGSVRTFTSGQRTIVTHDRGRKLEWWRIRVAHAAEKAAKRADWEPRYDGPVAVTATFLLPRPKSVPKSRLLPHTKPDLDKLARAIGDALAPYKRPGVLRDDSRIVDWVLLKRYARSEPGVHVEVLAVDAELAALLDPIGTPAKEAAS